MTLLRDFSFCFCCCSSTPFYCLRHTHTQKPFSRLAATVAPASVRHMISNIRRHTRETSALCAPAFHRTSSSNSNREKCHKHEKQKNLHLLCTKHTTTPKDTVNIAFIYMVYSYGITSKIIIGSGSSVFLYTRTGTNMKMPWIEYTKTEKNNGKSISVEYAKSVIYEVLQKPKTFIHCAACRCSLHNSHGE